MIVRGADELAAKTGRIADRLERPAGAERQLTPLFQQRIAQRFGSGGDGEWAPLSGETVETKARKGLDPGILRATGALEAALAGGHAEASGDQIRYAPASALFYGSIVAARRPILSSSEGELGGQIADALAAHVMGGE